MSSTVPESAKTNGIEAAASTLSHVRCNLCGADDTRPWSVRDGMHIVRCHQCGLIYVNPRYNDPNPGNIYDSGYFKYYLLTEYANRKTFERRLELLEKYKPQRGRILDVGCSIGDFMQVAKLRGWEPHGVDITPSFRDEILRRVGVEIKVGDFFQVPYEENYFDVVNLGDSIEHMMNPHEVMRKLFTILKPGGIGFIRAPDAQHLSPLLFRHKWIQIKPKEHLYYFTHRTMRRMLEQSGLEVLRLGGSGTYFTLNIFLDRVQHYFANASLTARTLNFFANTLKLGDLRFRFDVLEEMMVIFRKPE